MERNDDNSGFEPIDAYLDGQLTANDLATFERRLAAEADLRAACEAQSRIDGALRRLFIAPAAPGILAPSNGKAKAAASASPERRTTRRRWAAALAAAAAIALFVSYWTVYRGEDSRAAAIRKLTPRDFYTLFNDTVAEGFRPQWVCKDEQQFAATFKRRFHQGLALATAPGIQCDGISYAISNLSPYTACLLMEVDGKKAMVFVDRQERDKTQTTRPGEKMKLHRRVLGKTVLYELAQGDQPRVLGLFTTIDVPDEWLKKLPGYGGSIPQPDESKTGICPERR